jgi:septum formation protein
VRPIILASASPRRAELLRSAGIPFEVQAADVDESLRPGEAPEAYVRRLATEKANVVAARYPGRQVLAADTTVVVDDHVLGKPTDAADAARMLHSLAGRTHVVLTGVCLVGPDPGQHVDATERTIVEFSAMSRAEIDAYVRSGEPMDKAGAYAIQGLAARHVTRIDGSYSNVVGLPVALVYRLLREAGQQPE